jgi:hypothetical protein
MFLESSLERMKARSVKDVHNVHHDPSRNCVRITEAHLDDCFVFTPLYGCLIYYWGNFYLGN